ncbi:MAG: hypothetical protein ACI9SQ_002004, partial [Rubritalea sp.]
HYSWGMILLRSMENPHKKNQRFMIKSTHRFCGRGLKTL